MHPLLNWDDFMNECEVWLKEENRKDMRQQMKASAVEEDERGSLRNVIKPALWSGRIQLIDGVLCGSGSVVDKRKEWSQHPTDLAMERRMLDD